MNTDRQLILSPTGRQMFKIGEHAWRSFSVDPAYNVSIEWHTEGKECEPVMCLWRKWAGLNAPVFAICLSSAAAWGDPSGKPARGALIRAFEAITHLGADPNMLEVRKFLDVVLRHLPDLLRCPPMPPAARRAEAGEALLEITTINEQTGKTINETVI
jgi:hypothetical protein